MDFLQAALKYRTYGWSIVPLQPKGKAPLIPWAKYQTQLPTEKEIRQWWAKQPDANVGVVTGRISNLVVKDVDPDRMPGHEGLGTDFFNDLASTTSVVSQTGKGGMHLFFSYPPNAGRIPNVVGKDGIDIRAEGGIIALPPSRHPNGHFYKWIRSPNGSAVLPPPPPGPPLGTERQPEDRPGATEGHWLGRVLQGVGHGERNGAAARLAGYYYKKHFPVDVTIQLMTDWNLKNTPPLVGRELLTTIHSVYKTAGRRRQESEQDGIENPFAVVPFHEFMQTHGAQEINWVISDWMPDKTIAMMVAPPGTYKTWLELDLSVSIATGRPFLGRYEINRSGPVIIVQQEDFHGQTAIRLSTILNSKMDLDHERSWNKDSDEFNFRMPPRLPIYLHPDRRLRFDDDAVMDALEETVSKIKPILVVIDPLYAAGATDDYLAKTVQQMFQLKKMRDTYGCSFLLAHHTKKRSETSQREDAWGSQFLNAFLETGWQIRPRDVPGQAIIRRHFKVRQSIEEQMMVFKINTEPPYEYDVRVKDIKAGSSPAPGIIDIMASTQTAMTATEIAKLMGVSPSTVSRKLDTLIAAGEIVRNEDKKVALPRGLWQE